MTSARSNAPQILQAFLEHRSNEEAGYVCDVLFPAVQVNKTYGKYKSVSAGLSFADVAHADLIRESHAQFPEVSYTVSNTDLWELKEIGLKSFIDKKDLEESAEDGFDEAKAAIDTALHGLMIAREVKARSAIEAADSPTSLTSNQWNDSGADPRDQSQLALRTMRKAFGAINPMDVVALIYPEVWEEACRQETAVSRFRFDDLGANQMMNEAQFAAFLGVGKVVVPYAVRNTADEGQSASNDYVFSGDKVSFIYAPAQNSYGRVNSALARFQKGGAPRLEQMDVGFRRIEYLVSRLEDLKVVNSDGIVNFDDVLQ